MSLYSKLYDAVSPEFGERKDLLSKFLGNHDAEAYKAAKWKVFPGEDHVELQWLGNRFARCMESVTFVSNT